MKRREFGLLAGAASMALLSGTSRGLAQDMDLKPTSGETVFMRGWQFRTDVVQSNVERYNQELGGHVDYATVTGDYPALMEQNLMANAELDMLYANPSSAARYFDAGWIVPMDELPNYEQIKADMLPNLLDAWSYKGKQLGLSYFASTRGTIVVNLKAYEEAGMSPADYPKNWDELYDQIYALQEKGVERPFLPHWFNEWFGISWGFVLEVMNRGGTIADPETHEPTITTDEDGPYYKTLAAWKKLWNSGMVPEEVFTYNEAGYIDAFASGRYIFSPQQIYDIATFNSPERSQVAGQTSLLPFAGQPWGIIDSGIYLMSNRERSEALTEDVKKFTSWYGYKDHTGDFYVAKRWMQENMLFSGYRSVMESPETEERIKAAIARPEDYKAILDVYQNTPFPKGVWSVVWSEEFNPWLKENLASFLLDDGDIVEMLEAMTAKIEELNDKYGI
ncbi:ABC transporter substrate-binding protein [Geminicoccus roseus]|uniref:ABC transporter substrate-binding protein n=1 Tax=Geminicoccus roseus TaxID=404900 RepID=UPI0003F73940|nr:extracellular solute-binding protein [Geminicoccus roseus]